MVGVNVATKYRQKQPGAEEVEMHILALSREIPATSSMPGSPRFFHLCKELSRSHQLTLLTFQHSGERRIWFDQDPASRGVFSEITVLPPQPSARWLNKQLHRLVLASHLRTNYHTPKFHREVSMTVHEHTMRGRVDALFVDGLVMTQYLGAVPHTPKLVDLADCLTLLFQRTRETEQSWCQRMLLSLEIFDVSRWERSLGRSRELVLTVSPIDEQALRALAPKMHVQTISNGIDTEYFSPAFAPPKRERLIFTGVMGYGPNEDAVLYFAREIFPKLRVRHPKCEFLIVGYEPSVAVQALGREQGIAVTGTVADVRPYVSEAGIYVSPLRYGAGMKNKILAALALGKPTVASPISLDGISVEGEKDILIASNADTFVDQISRLLTDDDLYSRLSNNGPKLVREKYSWEMKGKELEAALRSLIGDKAVGG